MSEFWIFAEQTTEGDESLLDFLTSVVQNFKIAEENDLFMPPFRVGGFGGLMAISEDVGRVGNSAERLTIHLAAMASDLISPNNSSFLESILSMDGQSLQEYVFNFHWNEARYPPKQPIRVLISMIRAYIVTIERGFKIQLNKYNTVSMAVQAYEKRKEGNLLNKSLHGIVDPDDDITRNSRVLTTAYIVVPISLIKGFIIHYHSLDDGIVPNSLEYVTDDTEYVLFSVVILKNAYESLKIAARDKKYTVKEPPSQFDVVKLESDNYEKLKVVADKEYNILTKLLKVHFKRVFSSWVHCVVLGAFIETTLRFGISPNRRFLILMPYNEKAKKKLLGLIENFFKVFSNNPFGDEIAESDKDSQLMPYVIGRVPMQEIIKCLNQPAQNTKS